MNNLYLINQPSEASVFRSLLCTCIGIILPLLFIIFFIALICSTFCSKNKTMFEQMRRIWERNWERNKKTLRTTSAGIRVGWVFLCVLRLLFAAVVKGLVGRNLRLVSDYHVDPSSDDHASHTWERPKGLHQQPDPLQGLLGQNFDFRWRVSFGNGCCSSLTQSFFFLSYLQIQKFTVSLSFQYL